jgi:hypothetical protein
VTFKSKEEGQNQMPQEVDFLHAVARGSDRKRRLEGSIPDLLLIRNQIVL